MLTPALAAYEYWANKAPVRTKALTAATLTAASMILAQWITQLHGGVSGVEERRASRAKTAKMFLFGLLVSGPSAHYWHELLERCFKGSQPTTMTLVKKVVVDQLTYGPLCNLAAMAYIGLVVEGQLLRDWLRSLRTSFPAACVGGWKVWPLATLVQFHVPINLRPLFMNAVGMLWTTLLVTTAAKGPRTPPTRHPKRQEIDDHGKER